MQKHAQSIGNRGVRTTFPVGTAEQIVKVTKEHHLKVLGFSECRWTGFGKNKTKNWYDCGVFGGDGFKQTNTNNMEETGEQ